MTVFLQEQQAALQIHMLPAQVKNFAKAAAGEEKQPKRSRRGRIDLCEPLWGLRYVLGVGFGFVHRPRDADGFRLSDRATQPLQFLAGQEAFATTFLKLVDTSCRIGAFRNDASAAIG